MRTITKLFFVLELWGGSAAAESTLRAAVPRSFPPFYEQSTDGRPAGYAIDLMQALAARAGYRIEFIVTPGWVEALELLKTGGADVVPNLGITPERRRDLIFSRPTDAFEIRAFVSNEGASIRTLDGQRVGLLRISAAQQLVEKAKPKSSTHFDSTEEAILALLSHDIDVLLLPDPVVRAVAFRAGLSDRLQAAPFAPIKISRGIAARPGLEEAIERLDRVIPDFLLSEDYDEIRARWLRYDTGSVVPWLPIFAGVAAALLFGAAAARYFTVLRMSRRLKDEVEHHRVTLESLAASERRYQSVLENSLDGVWILDDQGRTLYANPAMNAMLGVSPTGFARRSWLEVVAPPHRDDAAASWESCRRGIGERRALDLVHGDGSTVHTETLTSPILDGDAFRGVTIFVRDVTERWRQEEQARALSDRLREEQKMSAIGTLATGIAHDFNNVLQGILTSVSLAQEKDGADRARHLSSAEQFTLRGRDLVRQILLYSRPKPAEQRLIDLRTVVDDAVKLLRATMPTSIAWKVAEDGEPVWVRGGATQLQQVVLNLGANAGFSYPDEQGVVTIDVTAEGNLAVLRVSDAGEGIAPEEIPRLFDPFYTTRPHGRGTGLGLPVVQGIVRSHGGRIAVESKRGEGTTFTVTLPRAPANEGEREAQQAPEAAPQTTGGHERVLLVDDETEVLDLCRELLKSLGYDVEAAASADEALRMVAERPAYDVVVTDNAMPGRSGVELGHELKRRHPSLPLILYSGYLSADTGEDGPFALRLAKPVSPAELARAIRTVLAR